MFNTVKFIKEVAKRPALWMKDESGKSIEKRMEAWFDLCEIMFKDDGYNYLSIQEKFERKQMLIRKWRNLKDSFTKYLRSKRLGLSKRRYLYYNHLKFLLPLYKDQYPIQTKNENQDCLDENEDSNSSGSLPYNDDESSNPLATSIKEPKGKSNFSLSNLKGEHSDDDSYDRFDNDDQQMVDSLDSNNMKSNLKRKRTVSNNHNNGENPINSSADQSRQEMDPNRLFLLSLQPLIENLNPEDNLQARIDVLQLLQKYQKRNQEYNTLDQETSSAISNV